jgi:hypothetical protein
MKSIRTSLVKVPAKAPTGIVGFDEITGGGLPRGRTTLLVGGPGSGKTILALQFLVHGAKHCKEPGIFVAFEETSKRIVANAEGSAARIVRWTALHPIPCTSIRCQYRWRLNPQNCTYLPEKSVLTNGATSGSIVRRTVFECANCVIFAYRSRHENEWNVAVRLVGDREGFHAVERRHAEIAQDYVRLHLRESSAIVIRGLHHARLAGDARPSQLRQRQSGVRRDVFNNKYLQLLADARLRDGVPVFV